MRIDTHADTHADTTRLITLIGVLATWMLIAVPFDADAQPVVPPGAPMEGVRDSASIGPFTVYRSNGTPISLAEIRAALDTVDVVFVGETHDDPTAHALQDSIFRFAETAATTASRSVALSLEMFERDVQPILDEYLAGTIAERHFIHDARAWSNYRSAYARLVNRARDNGYPVLAANAPRRYVHLVARSGPEALNALPETAKDWLAPLPYPGPTSAYQEKWRDLMRQSMPPDHGRSDAATDTSKPPAASTQNAPPHHAGSSMLQAQSLWDATMAHTLARHLLRHPGALIVHLTGAFHVSGGTGTPEALRHYRPSARTLVVVIQPSDDPDSFDIDRHAGLGDVVILTDASRVPSRNR